MVVGRENVAFSPRRAGPLRPVRTLGYGISIAHLSYFAIYGIILAKKMKPIPFVAYFHSMSFSSIAVALDDVANLSRMSQMPQMPRSSRS